MIRFRLVPKQKEQGVYEEIVDFEIPETVGSHVPLSIPDAGRVWEAHISGASVEIVAGWGFVFPVPMRNVFTTTDGSEFMVFYGLQARTLLAFLIGRYNVQ